MPSSEPDTEWSTITHSSVSRWIQILIVYNLIVLTATYIT